MATAISLDQENDLRYTIPSWFLQNNVQTNAESTDDDPGLAVVDDVSGDDEGKTRPAVFEIRRDDYDAIQLTAAAALIRDEAGKLPAKAPSILLDMKMGSDPVPGGVVYFDRLVKRLARDLGADLISVSPDDLETLGRIFHLQDQERQEDSAAGNNGNEPVIDKKSRRLEQLAWDSPYAFAHFYFGVRSERKGTAESQKRNRSAINALLDSVRVKREGALESKPADDKTTDPPVLLHLMNLKLLDIRYPRWPLLRRFVTRLEQRRTAAEEAGERILGIASETSKLSPKTECRKFLSYDYSTFCISSPPNYSSHEDFYRGRELDYIRESNIHRFKRTLQARLGTAFESGLLDLHDNEHVRQRWLSKVFLGEKACSANDLDRAAIQVAGRQWGNHALTFDDVIAVTTRMRRKGNWDESEEEKKKKEENSKEEEDKKEERDKEQGGDKKDAWKGLTLKQLQDKVSPQCNDYERTLLDCIANPVELSSTYDDVIIDEETKEHVKQLVNLSQIRLEAASKTLLQDLNVSGALFYGAPGTGKTLLCKAIAKDSSSNMLVLRPSDVYDKYVGETEKTIAAAFSLAAKLSPCVLFIDEVDAMFYRRGDNDKSWERSALTQFLQEMDGLTSQNKGNAPFVIVGTNRPGDLDDAFLRRLPHKVLFTLPSTTERERILRVFLHDDDVDPQVNFSNLANKTEGFSGSDLRSLCGHAALAWAVEQKRIQPSQDVETLQVHLQQHHFDVALRKTKPTVSPQSTKSLEEFARRFNPEDYNRSSACTDNLNITSKTKSSPVPISLTLRAPTHPGGHSYPRPHQMWWVYSASVAHQISEWRSGGIPGCTLDGQPPTELTSNIETEPEALPTESIVNIGIKPADRSLGRVTEDCFGIAGMETRYRTMGTTEVWPATMKRALTNWYRLQFLVSRGVTDEIFSWEQRHSYQVLYDWWSASFEHPSVPLFYLMAALRGSGILSGECAHCEFEEHGELWVCIFYHIEKLRQAGGRFEDKPDISDYSRAMWQLFLYEFRTLDAYIADERFNIMALARKRREAVLKAYCQLAALKCSRRMIQGPPLHRILNDPHWVLSVEASDPSHPRTLSRGPLIRACPWLDPSPSTSFTKAQGIGGDEDELCGWPEYLWDISNRRVVHIRDFQDKRPPYVAISHTWGRWQLKDQWVPMEGGLELPIPCNSVFDVNKLPEMLLKLKTLNDKIAVEYVWIDLLCIPQVPLGGTEAIYEPWIPIQRREIARQGSIFRNAWAAIAWFHDIDSLSCIGALFELLSLSSFSLGTCSPDDLQLKRITEAAYGRIRQGRTGLLNNRTGAERMKSFYPQIPRMGEPSSWFTSLWTLQEVCLRPDMWLATSEWDILTVGQDEPMPLNGFLCVQHEMPRDWFCDTIRDETAASEMVAWSLATGLDNLLDLSQLDILKLGDRRHCSGKRAEAIMSAIGATKWFSRVSNHEENLILGKYPYEFIQEIREFVPGDFFATYAKLPRIDKHDDHQATRVRMDGLHGRGLVRSYEAAEIRGSLLPFSHMGHVYLPVAVKRYRLHTHDSVCLWEITTSGRVKMESACILSSSTLTDIPKSPEVLPCHFMGFCSSADDYKNGNPIHFYTDMHKWTSARKSEIHLVVVMHSIVENRRLHDERSKDTTIQDGGMEELWEDESFRGGAHIIQGIVIRSTKTDSLRTAKKEGKVQGADGKPQRLVKIGIFFARGSGEVVLPEARKVSWEIL